MSDQSDWTPVGSNHYVPLAGFEIENPSSDKTRKHNKYENSSPEDFLKEERRRTWTPPADLDHFFQRIYHYYCNKGFWCIVTQWLVEILTLGFIIVFSAILLLVVDWSSLLSARCGLAAAEEGHPPCNLLEIAVKKEPLTPLTPFKLTVLVYLVAFSLYWLHYFLRFFADLRELLEIRDFCHQGLCISESKLRQLSWPALLDALLAFQASHPGALCVVRDLNPHHICARIMRKQNYLAAMLNKGVLDIPSLPAWMPGVAPSGGSWDPALLPGRHVGGKLRRQRKKGRVLLTKTVEWCLHWCVLHYMFDSHFCIRSGFSTRPSSLRHRLRLAALLLLLLSPFLCLFLCLHSALRHAELIYHNPAAAGGRSWTNLAKWRFRELNELDHFFQQRLSASHPAAEDFCRQFPSPLLSLLAKFVAFVTGAMAAVLLGLALLDENLLEAQLFGRNLLWYGAVLGSILAASRALVTEEHALFHPQRCLERTARHTHYMPKHWREGVSEEVRAEFEGLFQLKALVFVEELASLLLAPLLLWVYLPQCVDGILDFVQTFTVHVEGVGHVCSLSVFDFEQHGNPKYGSPCEAPKPLRSAHGKMEKSFLGFTCHYPNWEPSKSGKEFLSHLSQSLGSQQLTDAVGRLNRQSGDKGGVGEGGGGGGRRLQTGRGRARGEPHGSNGECVHGIRKEDCYCRGRGGRRRGGRTRSQSPFSPPSSPSSSVNYDMVQQLMWQDKHSQHNVCGEQGGGGEEEEAEGEHRHVHHMYHYSSRSSNRSSAVSSQVAAMAGASSWLPPASRETRGEEGGGEGAGGEEERLRGGAVALGNVSSDGMEELEEACRHGTDSNHGLAYFHYPNHGSTSWHQREESEQEYCEGVEGSSHGDVSSGEIDVDLGVAAFSEGTSHRGRRRSREEHVRHFEVGEGFLGRSHILPMRNDSAVLNRAAEARYETRVDMSPRFANSQSPPLPFGDVYVSPHGSGNLFMDHLDLLGRSKRDSSLE